MDRNSPVRTIVRWTQALCLSALVASPATANPTGARVRHGQVAFNHPAAGVLEVRNSPNAIISWQSFSVGRGEVTRFLQQSAASAVLNRVRGGDPSNILGRLTSNGRVFLINPNGIVIGKGAVVDTAAFVGSTLDITDADFLAGRLEFRGGEDPGSIENHGVIQTAPGGDVYLLAPNIHNSGDIISENGRILLAAGKRITISSLDGNGLHFEVQAPEDSVVNLGRLIANGGAAEVFAGTLHHAGEVRADSLSVDDTGAVVLTATERLETTAGSSVSAAGPAGGTVTLGSATSTTLLRGDISAAATDANGGRIDVSGARVAVLDGALDASGATAGGRIRVGGGLGGSDADMPNASHTTVAAGSRLSADATTHGDGGEVIVWAEQQTLAAGAISARGGPTGGNGGFVETSARENLAVAATPDVSAPNGAAGTWLIDPNDVAIVAGGGNVGIDDANPFASTADGAQLGVDLIEAALAGGADVIVSTSGGGSEKGDITLAAPLQLDDTQGSNTLTLSAHRDIRLDAPIVDTVPGGQTLDLVLEADSDGMIDGGDANGGVVRIGADVDLGGGTLDARSLGSGVVEFSADTAIDARFEAGSITVASGTQTFNGNAVFDEMTLAGGVLAGSGIITIVDALTWTGGTIAIDTGAAGGSAFAIDGAATKTLDAVLTNSGTLTFGPGSTGTLAGSGTLANLKDRVVEIAGDPLFSDTLSLSNDGILRRTTSSNTLTLPSFANLDDGVVEVQSGTLVLGDSSTHAGDVDVAQGAALELGGATATHDFLAGSSVGGAGDVYFTDGVSHFDASAVYDVAGSTTIMGGDTQFDNAAGFATLLVNGGSARIDGAASAEALALAGGIITGSGTLTLLGSGSWSGGDLAGSGVLRVDGDLTIGGAGTRTLTERRLENRGSLLLDPDDGTALTLALSGAAMLGNETGAGMTVVEDVTITGAGGTQVVNRGSITSSATNFLLDADFVNESLSTVAIEAGTTRIRTEAGRTNANSGFIDVAAGASLAIDGDTPATVFTNAVGAVLSGNGSIDASDPDVSLVNAGRIEPGASPGALSFSGGLVLADSSIIELDLGGAAIAGTDYDLVHVDGDLTLGGRVETHLFADYRPIAGDAYRFITYTGSLDGAFTAAPQAPLGVGFGPLELGVANEISIGVTTVGSIRSWTSPTGGNWNDAANWSDPGLGIPGPADIVHINQPGSLTISITSDVGTILAIDSQETIAITGGNGVLSVSNDPAEGLDSVIETLVQSTGTFTGTDTVTITDRFTWSGGWQTGTGETVIAPGADLLLSGGTRYVSGRTLRNRSQTTTSRWTGGNLYLNGVGGAFVNEGTLEVAVSSGTLHVYNYAGGDDRPVFDNRGTLVKTGAGQLYQEWDTTFVGGGLLDAQAGTVTLRSFQVDGATWQVADGALVQQTWDGYVGNLLRDVTLAGAGELRFTNQTTSIEGGLTVPTGLTLRQTGGTVTSNDLVRIDGTFRWENGWQTGTGERRVTPGGELLLTSGGTKYLSGNVLRNQSATSRWDGGNLYLNGDAGAFVNEGALEVAVSSGTLALYNYSSGDDRPLFDNRGTLVKTGAGQFYQEWDTTFVGGGLLDVQAGTVTLRSFQVDGATWQVADGALVQQTWDGYVGNLLRDLTLAGTGELRFTNQTTTLEGGLTVPAGMLLRQTNGTLTSNSALTVDGTFRWEGGWQTGSGERRVTPGGELLMTGGTKYLSGPVLVNESATSRWDGGDFYLNGSGSLVNAPGAVLRIEGSNTRHLYNYNGGDDRPVFDNQGTVVVNTPTGRWYQEWNTDFQSTGTLAVEAGYAELRNFDQLSGSWVVDPGAFVYVTQAGNGGPGNTVTDTAISGGGYFRQHAWTTLFGGTTTYDLPELRVTGGTATFDVDVTVDDLLISSGTLGGSGELVVNDRFDWQGGWLAGDGTNRLTVEPAGTLLMTGSGTKYLSNRRLDLLATSGSRWDDGNLYLNGDGDGTRFVIDTDARLDIVATGSATRHLYNYSGGDDRPVFENRGLLTVTTDTGRFYQEWNTDFQGTGALEVNAGYAELRNFDQIGGSWTIAPGAYVYVTQAGNGGPGNTVTDTTISGGGYFRQQAWTTTFGGTTTYDLPELRVTGGNVTFDVDFAVDDLVMTGGTLAGTGNLTVNDTWRWEGGTVAGDGVSEILVPATAELLAITSQHYASNRVIRHLSETGTSRWDNGQINLNDGALFVHGPDAVLTIDAATNETLYLDWDSGAPATFDNQGHITKTGPGTWDVGCCGSITFHNSGSVGVDEGTFRVVGGMVNQGQMYVQAGATLDFDSGTFTNAGDGLLGGTGTIDANSATLVNQGTIAPGYSVGTLTVLGNLTLDAAGVVDIELGGTAADAYDRLEVTGNASLGGTLRVREVGGFETAPGDSFEVMSYAGRGSTQFDLVDPSFGDAYVAPVEGVTAVTLVVDSVGNFVSWDGGGSSLDWLDPLNWSGDALPDLLDDVLIGSAAGAVSLAAGAGEARRLTIGADQQLLLGAGGSLALDSVAAVDNDNASFRLDGGMLGGAGLLQVDGHLDWRSGEVGLATLVTAGTAALGTAGLKSLASEWRNTGAVMLTDGVLELAAGATVLNTGSFEITGTNAAAVTGAGSFENSGILLKSGASTSTLSPAMFSNTGLVDVDAGTLRFTTDTVSSGQFDIAAGALVQLDGGTHVLGTADPFVADGGGEWRVSAGTATAIVPGTLIAEGVTAAIDGGQLQFGATGTVAGTLAVRGGNLNLDEALTVDGTLAVDGGLIDGAGTVTVPGTLAWTGGTVAPLLLTTSGTTTLAGAGEKTLATDWNNTGAVTLTAGTLRIDGADDTLSSRGIITLAAGDPGATLTGAGTLVNESPPAFGEPSGRIVKSGSDSFTLTVAHFVNAGLVDVQAGELRLAGDSTASGQFAIAGGAAANYVAGTHTLTASLPLTLESAGALVVSGGDVSINGNANLPFGSGLRLEGGR
ncbi:MAG: beta strand repeat-containing protein, partial [Gammaproteobacteria bacterium]